MDERMLRIVSDPARRRIIRVLRYRETPVEFTPDVTDLDCGIIDEEMAQCRLIELFHVHLPKLEDAGVITWNRDQETVAEGFRFDEICAVLDRVTDHDEKELDRSGFP